MTARKKLPSMVTTMSLDMGSFVEALAADMSKQNLQAILEDGFEIDLKLPVHISHRRRDRP